MRGPPEGWAMPSAWRHIPSCPGYMASDSGRIRNSSTGKLLFGERDKDGYRRVNLRVSGAKVKRSVHRLVCEAWNGPAPAGHHAAHLDGNPSNNRSTNLVWATPKENNGHKKLQGRPNGGAADFWRGRPVLSEETLDEVRRSPLSSRKAAEKFGISQSHVVRIRNGTRRTGPCFTVPALRVSIRIAGAR